jgi:hypothetical protein
MSYNLQRQKNFRMLPYLQSMYNTREIISMSILETLNIKQEFKIISFVKSQIQNENGNYQCELDDFFL